MHRILHIHHPEVLCSHIADIPLASTGRFDAETTVSAFKGYAAQGDIMDTAGDLAADRDSKSLLYPAVLHCDMMARPRDPPAIPVPSGLDADAVIIGPRNASCDKDIV